MNILIQASPHCCLLIEAYILCIVELEFRLMATIVVATKTTAEKMSIKSLFIANFFTETESSFSQKDCFRIMILNFCFCRINVCDFKI